MTHSCAAQSFKLRNRTLMTSVRGTLACTLIGSLLCTAHCLDITLMLLTLSAAETLLPHSAFACPATYFIRTSISPAPSLSHGSLRPPCSPRSTLPCGTHVSTF